MEAANHLRCERKFLISDLSTQEIEEVILLHPALFSPIYHNRFVNNIYFDNLNFLSYYYIYSLVCLMACLVFGPLKGGRQNIDNLVNPSIYPLNLPIVSVFPGMPIYEAGVVFGSIDVPGTFIGLLGSCIGI